MDCRLINGALINGSISIRRLDLSFLAFTHHHRQRTMDISGVTPNFVHAHTVHQLPDDLHLDDWFTNKDVQRFLTTVLGLRNTRARDKEMDDRPFVKAADVLEQAIIEDPDTWVSIHRCNWCGKS